MHLKRLLAPKFWKVKKKQYTWVVSPRPGPHKKTECIPLLIIVRDILKLAETGKEAKSLVKKGEILVDGKIRKDPKYPVGLFDVVSIPKISKSWRVVISKKGLELKEIPKEEEKKKILKIKNITVVKGGKFQLNLNDGKNILVEKKAYSTGDSLLVELPSLKIIKHIPLAEGNLVLIIKGKLSGEMLVVKKVIPGEFRVPPKVMCESKTGNVEVLKEHVIVVGENKPLITVS